jgi:arylsulfatase A-like enzyme
VAGLIACDPGVAPKETPPAAAQESRPNILIYIVDTLRPDYLGAYGNTRVETPAIDAFAKTGTVFENAYAPTSWTRASIASILTATAPSVHGAVHRDDRLAKASILASEVLQGQGYHTGLVTTNPNVGSFFGFNQGFDDFIELYARSDPGFVKATELTTTADLVASRAKQWIRNAPRPFFLVVHTIDPHSPYQPPEEYDLYGEGIEGTKYGLKSWINRKDLTLKIKQRIRSLYEAEVAFSDHAFGLLMSELGEQALLDQTITILTSDHGEEFWEHGSRGHGRGLYDEVLRVPLIVSFPPRVPAGVREDRVAQLMDIIPTALDLAGLPALSGSGGRSLFEADPQGSVTAMATLSLDRWSYVAIRDGQWKLIWDKNSGQRMLFDTVVGHHEKKDLSAAYPGRVRALAKRMDELLRQYEVEAVALKGADENETISPDELPATERKLLEELGYLEAEGGAP